MIVLVSLIVLLRGLLVPTVFRMVHPYISIQNNFYTCFTYFCEASVVARMPKSITCSLVPRPHPLRGKGSGQRRSDRVKSPVINITYVLYGGADLLPRPEF